jgi:hypothetical protein
LELCATPYDGRVTKTQASKAAAKRAAAQEPKPTSSKQCFVIAEIGDPVSEARTRANQFLHHIVIPVVSDCGYDVTRADLLDNPGTITRQIVQRLLEDDLVIADLTNLNPNVLYELAIRHAVRKPMVQVMAEGQRLPFDILDQRTIFFNIHDLDSVEDCKVRMRAQVLAVEKDSSLVDSPLSVAIDMQAAHRSDRPEEARFAEVMATLQDLGGRVASLARQISSLPAGVSSAATLPYSGVRVQSYDSLTGTVRSVPTSVALNVAGGIDYLTRGGATTVLSSGQPFTVDTSPGLGSFVITGTTHKAEKAP